MPLKSRIRGFFQEILKKVYKKKNFIYDKYLNGMEREWNRSRQRREWNGMDHFLIRTPRTEQNKNGTIEKKEQEQNGTERE